MRAPVKASRPKAGSRDARRAGRCARLVAVILVAFFAGNMARRCGAQGVSPSRRAAPTNTVAEIAAAIRANLERVRSFQVRTVMSSENLNPAIEDDDALVNGSFFRNIDEYSWADRGNKLARTTKFWKPQTIEEFKSRKFSLWQQSCMTRDGERFYQFTTEQKSGEPPVPVGASIDSVKAATYPRRFNQSNVYMECVGSFFYDGEDLDAWHLRESETDPPPQRPFSLPGVLESRVYALQPRREAVAGIECLVLESDAQDRLWLAPELGFAVVQREWRFGSGQPVMFRFVNSNFKELLPGLWLPQHAERFNMANLSHQNQSGMPHFVVRCDVTGFLVNDVPDPVFTIAFPPGVVVADGSVREGTTLVYNTGATPAATGRALDGAISDHDRQSDIDRKRGSRWPLLIVINVLMVLLAFSVVYFRRRRTRHD